MNKMRGDEEEGAEEEEAAEREHDKVDSQSRVNHHLADTGMEALKDTHR